MVGGPLRVAIVFALLMLVSSTVFAVITPSEQSTDFDDPYRFYVDEFSERSEYTRQFGDLNFAGIYSFRHYGSGPVVVGVTHIERDATAVVRLYDESGNSLELDSDTGTYSNRYVEVSHDKIGTAATDYIVLVQVEPASRYDYDTALTIYSGQRPDPCTETFYADPDNSQFECSGDILYGWEQQPNCELKFAEFQDCTAYDRSVTTEPYCGGDGNVYEDRYEFVGYCERSSDSCRYSRDADITTRVVDSCGIYGCEGREAICFDQDPGSGDDGSKCDNYNWWSVDYTCQVGGTGSCYESDPVCIQGYCGDGICDPSIGESSSSCSLDCGPTFCTSDSACTVDEYCDESAFRCELRPDECSTEGVVDCHEGEVTRCDAAESGRLIRTTLDNCNRIGAYCDESTVMSMQECAVSDFDAWIDHSKSRVVVNKQRGDVIVVTAQADTGQSVAIEYDKSILTTDCPSLWLLSAGTNTCRFTLSEFARSGESSITVGPLRLPFKVVSDPSSLAFTYGPNLAQRYSANGTTSILSAAYSSLDEGVLYDLSWYNSDHPFQSYEDYDESLGSFDFGANEFAEWAAGFIRDRTTSPGHTNVMLLGDDFVVPGYRRDIPMHERGLFTGFRRSDVSRDITTDVGAIQKSTVSTGSLSFSDYPRMFRRDGESAEGKWVDFIVPPDVTPEQLDAIERLKATFTEAGYDPVYRDAVDGSTVTCSDRSRFNGRAIIFIGTSETNPAMNCLPFIDGELDGIHYQPSPFDQDERALIFASDDPVLIDTSARLFEGGEIVELRSNAAYVTKATFDEVAEAGAYAVPLLLYASLKGKIQPQVVLGATGLVAAADAGIAVDECFLDYEGALICATDSAFVLTSVDDVAGGSVGRWLKGLVRTASLTSDQRRFTKEVIEEFTQSDTYLRLVAKRVGYDRLDQYHIARGISLMKQYDPDWAVDTWKLRVLGGSPPTDKAVADFLRDLGRLDASGTILRSADEDYVRVVVNYYSRASRTTGRMYEARVAARYLDEGLEVIKFGPKSSRSTNRLDTDLLARVPDGPYVAVQVKGGTFERAAFKKDVGKLADSLDQSFAVEVSDGVFEYVSPEQLRFAAGPEYVDAIRTRFSAPQEIITPSGNRMFARHSDVSGVDELELLDEAGQPVGLVRIDVVDLIEEVTV